MYVTLLKSLVVESLQAVFNSNWPNPNFTDLTVSIEYPLDRQSYPGIWTNYDDNDALQIAGINQREYVVDPDGTQHEVTRWTFAGAVTLTCVALSSLERDNLYDELVRIFAFSRVEAAVPEFRATIETNDLLALQVNWDQLHPHGDAAAPGTPWGTEDEVVYERSISFDVIGEFVSDWRTNVAVPLREIVVVGQVVDAEDDPLALNPFILTMPRQD